MAMLVFHRSVMVLRTFAPWLDGADDGGAFFQGAQKRRRTELEESHQVNIAEELLCGGQILARDDNGCSDLVLARM